MITTNQVVQEMAQNAKASLSSEASEGLINAIQRSIAVAEIQTTQGLKDVESGIIEIESILEKLLRDGKASDAIYNRYTSKLEEAHIEWVKTKTGVNVGDCIQFFYGRRSYKGKLEDMYTNNDGEVELYVRLINSAGEMSVKTRKLRITAMDSNSDIYHPRTIKC